MIVFDLACQCGLTFEGWFQDTSDFERQLASGHISCPACCGSSIRKILSPVAVHTSRINSGIVPADDKKLSEEEAAQLALGLVQQYVEQHFDDVGAGLAEQALKMHYGVASPRNIRGVATPAEEEILKGEGIELLKLPMPVKKEGEN